MYQDWRTDPYTGTLIAPGNPDTGDYLDRFERELGRTRNRRAGSLEYFDPRRSVWVRRSAVRGTWVDTDLGDPTFIGDNAEQFPGRVVIVR